MILVTAVADLITDKPTKRDVSLLMFHPDLHFNILMLSPGQIAS